MAEIIAEPTALSKVIALKFKINDVDVPKTTQLPTNKQFNTTDTDAWFTFELDGLASTSGTYDLTLINLDDKSIFHHADVLFAALPFHYKLSSSDDVTLNEIRHAGRWLGQLVVTMSNGDTTARQFGFNIAGHILDGQDAQVILLSDYQALINTINLAKDDLAQYNVDYAALLVDIAAAEDARVTAYNQLLADQQANIEAFDVALDEGIVAANLATKLQDFEATNNSRLLSAEQQLADTNVLSAEAVAKADAMASGSPKGVYTTLALLQAAYPTGTTGAYLVTADGKWYYWSGSAWAIGGTYQSAGIAERSVTREKVAKNLVSLEESVELSLSDFTYDNVTVGFTDNILTSAAETRYYHSCFLPENVYEVSFNPLLIAKEVWLILGGDSTRFTAVQFMSTGIKLLTEIINSGTLSTNYLMIESGTRYAATITAADVIKVSYFNGKYSFYINGVLVYTLDNALLTNPNAVGIKTNNRLGFILQKAYNDSAGAVKIVDVKTDTLLTDRVNSIDQALADLVGTPLKNTIVNFLGDSITEGPIYKGYTSYVDILSARTGITARNYGITSSRITYKSDRTDAFCTRYTNMDDNADVVIVFGGTNDHTDVPLGTWGDSTNDTLNGAIKILIEGLLTKYAGKAIGFVIPLPKIGNIGDTGTLKNYVDAIKYACKQYSVPVLDLYTQSGLAPNLAIQRTILMPDGLHPNYTGQELISYKIEAFIKMLA